MRYAAARHPDQRRLNQAGRRRRTMKETPIRGDGMTEFPKQSEAVVIGASGGIGAALAARLAADPRFATVHALARTPLEAKAEKVRTGQIDLTDEDSVAAAASQTDAPRLVIVASGILHEGEHGPEKSFKQLEADWLRRVLDVNTVGPALAAKHFLPKLPREGKAVFAAISARVGSISDNRLGGWYGYRASKAALNMILKCSAVELARTHKEASVLGLHPGTVDTALSEPFQSGVSAGKLFTPDYAAQCLLKVLEETTPEFSGQIFAWDGQVVPP
jgi:NAD(P)-dependent dehydrogenase (short-subunit alcohol dehydrogenase family)